LPGHDRRAANLHGHSFHPLLCYENTFGRIGEERVREKRRADKVPGRRHTPEMPELLFRQGGRVVKRATAVPLTSMAIFQQI
jgi:hypothetical protein